jgi:hypothetical protein
MDLRNVGILPQHYTASQPRRPRLENFNSFCKNQEITAEQRKWEMGNGKMRNAYKIS